MFLSEGFNFNFEPGRFVDALGYMGIGMGCIFIVIFLIILSVYITNYFVKRFSKK